MFFKKKLSLLVFLAFIGFLISAPVFLSNANLSMVKNQKMVAKEKSIKIGIKLKMDGNWRNKQQAELEAFLDSKRSGLTCKSKKKWECPEILILSNAGLESLNNNEDIE